MTLDLRYPAISDLRAKANRRLPAFAFEYLDSSTGSEKGYIANRAALDAVHFMPAVLKGTLECDLSTTLNGTDYPLPFGVAPVGMSGMIWPAAERILARTAREAGIPYGLSTVATATPEEVGPLAGPSGWFQLYPLADRGALKDLLGRVKASGFTNLVMTVDVPGESRRERQRRAQVALPFKITPWIAWQVVSHPIWALGTLRTGSPTLKTLEPYTPKQEEGDAFHHAGRMIRAYPDWDYLDAVREIWDGPLWIKGVLDPADATEMRKRGVDGIWVSNHSARQFEAGPSPIDQLPLVRKAVGPDVPIIADSGVQGGLDIMRYMARGADFVFLGRAWHYALGALGEAGAQHLIHILREDISANMTQIGISKLSQLPDRLI